MRRMQPRALMIPPGLPGFPERTRTVERRPCLLEGRAWSGEAPVAVVEVSDDGGATWTRREARAGRRLAVRLVWLAASSGRRGGVGEHELCCRARDRRGNTQPLEPVENLGGYVNNGVQRVQRDRPRLG